jgi:hypothetical protein
MICPYLKCRLFWHFKTKVSCSKLFLFRVIVRNGILRVCLYSTIWNSLHFSLPRNGSKQNSESFLFFWTAGILSGQTICFVYFVFWGIFLSEIPNPTQTITENNKFVNIKCASTNIFRDQQNSVAMEPLNHTSCLSQASSPTRFVPASKCPNSVKVAERSASC